MVKSTVPFTLESRSLVSLLAQAQMLVRRHAVDHLTQRGKTYSVNKVILTWKAPQIIDEPGLRWSSSDIQWYLDVFVNKSANTDPLTQISKGNWLFPYTYAARSRFWDAGWSNLAVLLRVMRSERIDTHSIGASKGRFVDSIVRLSEHLHLQLVLSNWGLHGPRALGHYLEDSSLADSLSTAWRRDNLETAIEELRSNAFSRRAVVTSFSYPQLNLQSKPALAVPPYQLFQLLPGDSTTPVSSIHEHRSLDVLNGAPLDFWHDLTWLNEASVVLKRPIGDITIVAHNLHEYQDEEKCVQSASQSELTIAQWLARVTDAYLALQGTPGSLIQEPTYSSEVDHLYDVWYG